MNLIFHIVRKDLRRLAVPLGAWLALVAGKAATLVAYARGNLPWPGEWLGTAVDYANWMEAVVGFALAAWLVIEDAPADTRTFWVTRPISGRRLLAAKLAGAALMFVALPLVLLLPSWLAAGFGPREVALAAASWALLQGALTVAALVFSAVSTNSAQVLLGPVALAPLLVAGLWFEWRFPGGRTGLVCVFVLTTALALGLQFLRRWRRAAAGSVAVGMGLLALGAELPARHPNAEAPLHPASTSSQPLAQGGVQTLERSRWRLRAITPRRKDVNVELRELGFHSFLFSGWERIPSCLLDAGGNEPESKPRSANRVGRASAASLRVTDHEAPFSPEDLPGATWRLVYPAPEINAGNSSPSPTP